MILSRDSLFYRYEFIDIEYKQPASLRFLNYKAKEARTRLRWEDTVVFGTRLPWEDTVILEI